MKNLLYVSPVPWTSFAQRPHKFVSWFHRRHGGKVMWLEPYATRFPALADIRRVRQGGSSEPANPVPDWLTVLRPASLPIEPIPGSGSFNSRLWRSTLSDAIDFARQGDCIVVVGKPSLLAIQLVLTLPRCMSIYDAMDDFPAFYRGFSRAAMKRRETKLVSLADEVWTSSTLLHERWNSRHKEVRLVHNGLDLNAVKLPEAVAVNADRMVFGYLGTIGNWFDWDMMLALARAVPNDLVRILGPVYKPAPGQLPKNIEMLPPCEHAEAMVRMTEFDVGLIPFLKNELTDSVDPIKYYEYRAFGIPVVSSDFGEMRYRNEADGVYRVRDLAELEEIVGQVRHAIQPRRLDICFAEENSWAARFDQAGTGFERLNP